VNNKERKTKEIKVRREEVKSMEKEEFKLGRRSLLKGIAGLSAAVVASSSVPTLAQVCPPGPLSPEEARMIYQKAIRVINLLTTDPAFRELFKTDTAQALREAGVPDQYIHVPPDVKGFDPEALAELPFCPTSVTLAVCAGGHCAVYKISD